MPPHDVTITLQSMFDKTSTSEHNEFLDAIATFLANNTFLCLGSKHDVYDAINNLRIAAGTEEED